MSAKMVVRDAGNGTDSYWLWCPACNAASRITSDKWTWNGDLEAPTFSPSILAHETPVSPRCHSFVTDGVWHFLDDCTHDQAGRSVPMVELPDWIVSP